MTLRAVLKPACWIRVGALGLLVGAGGCGARTLVDEGGGDGSESAGEDAGDGDGRGGDSSGEDGSDGGGLPEYTCGDGVLEAGELCEVGPSGTCTDCNIVTAPRMRTVRSALTQDGVVYPMLDLDGDGIGEFVGSLAGEGSGAPASDRPDIAIFSGVEAYAVGAGEVAELNAPRWVLPAEATHEVTVQGAWDIDGDGEPELLVARRPILDPPAPWVTHVVAGETLSALAAGAAITPATMSRWSLALSERTGNTSPYATSIPALHDVQSVVLIPQLPLFARDFDGDGAGDFVLSQVAAIGPEDVAVLLASDVVAQPPGTTLDVAQARWTFLNEETAPLESGFESLMISAAADLDGDGRPEIFVRRDSRTFVFSGERLASIEQGGVVGTSEADWVLVCDKHSQYACFGASAIPVGDMDADGVLDLAVVNDYLDFSSEDPSLGDVHIVSGARILGGPRGAERALADLGPTLRSVEVEYFGSAVAVMGDVEGDGHADLWIQAASSDGAGGAPTERIFMVRGASLGTLEPGVIPVASIAHFTLRGGEGVRFGRGATVRGNDSTGATGLVVSKNAVVYGAPTSDGPGVWGSLILDNPF